MKPNFASVEDPNEELDTASSRSSRKKMITIRLDPTVIAWFKSKGPKYQTQINNALRQSMIQTTVLRTPGSPIES